MTRVRAEHPVDVLAREFLARHGLAGEPPIDPGRLAETLGVPVIDSDIAEDGRVEWTAGGPVIRLARGTPLERRRFTLAHELGHVLLHTESLLSPVLEATCRRFTSEEVLCNALAGSMLMPHPWVTAGFAGEPQDLRTIEALAVRAGVSLSAAVVRLRHVLGWRRTLLQWRAEGAQWTYDAEAGVWPSEQGVIKSSEGTSWALNAMRSSGVVSDTIYLPLRLGSKLCDVLAEVRIMPARALVLVDSPSCLSYGASASSRRRRTPRRGGRGSVALRASY